MFFCNFRPTSILTIRFKCFLTKLSLAAFVLLISGGYATGADVTLGLDNDGSQSIAGYRIYYKTEVTGLPYNGTGIDQGPSPVDFPIGMIDDSQSVNLKLTGLADDTNYYFTASVYDDHGNESHLSNEAFFYAPAPPPVVYKITSFSSGNGTISSLGDSEVFEGDTKTYTILADAYHEINDVMVDGQSVGAAASYTIENITSDHMITASFTPINYVITASAGAGGSITPSGSQSYTYGQMAKYTIRPDFGYHVTGIIVDGKAEEPTSTYSFHNVNASHHISASFGVNTFNGANTFDFDADIKTLSGSPFWQIPGRIEAENYDTGGEGVGYHDGSSGNKGLAYRDDDVDIWYSLEEQYYTGSNASGEWLTYTVDVETSGMYSLDLRVATPNSGRLMHVEMDGADITGPIELPNTGGWNKWQTVMTTVDLSQGKHMLRVVFDLGGLNYSWLDIFPIGFVNTAATPTIRPNGGIFKGPVQVSLQTKTSGAKIYYTTDGSIPDYGSTQYTAPFTLAGNASVKAIAIAPEHNDSIVSEATFLQDLNQQQPYRGIPWPVPGIVEAEDYDDGGQGIAYHDGTAGNRGGQYRTDDVDIWYSNTEGYYTGGNAAGDWLTYTVFVEIPGLYNVNLRLASPNSGRLMHVEIDGVDATGPMEIPNTGSWSAWQTIGCTLGLDKGLHAVRIVFDEGGVNFNWMEFEWLYAMSADAITIPARIEAEDYDDGGQGIAYHDGTAGNRGGQYRTDDVDIWYSDTEGYYTGGNAAGDWLTYTVFVEIPGLYNANLRLASPNSGRLMHVEIDGVDATGPMEIPNTGSWSAWQTIGCTMNLRKGWHVLRVVFDDGGLNFNWMDIHLDDGAE